MNEHLTPSYGKRVFLCFVLFFATFCAVDVIMVTTAIETNTGVVTQQPYEKGLAYNQTLDEAQRQEALGWQGRISYEEKGLLSFALTDKAGRLLRDAEVTAKIMRPADNHFDQVLTLRATQAGNYEAPLKLTLPGLWMIRVFAQYKKQSYQISKTLMIERS